MSKAIINIKTNPEIKKNAQKLAKDLGLSLSDVINASLRNFIKNREVIFSHIPKMTSELEELLRIVDGDISNKKNLSAPISNNNELADYLSGL